MTRKNVGVLRQTPLRRPRLPNPSRPACGLRSSRKQEPSVPVPGGFETYCIELAEAGDPGRRQELAAKYEVTYPSDWVDEGALRPRTVERAASSSGMTGAHSSFKGAEMRCRTR